ncbi:MAG: hypothetical protein COA73_00795 [Candidatus Hydrogenedentota bacterium]|nr:MAG: hypothetical protein COA73_00795 [Candidatus Hydrogenedentota bacterium]
MKKNNMRHTTRKSKNGFTLVEVLMAIAIMSIVTTLGARSFTTLTSSWNETRILSELNQSIQAAFDTIQRDTQDVLSAELSGVSIIGEHRNAENIREFEKAADADDRVVLPVQGNISGRSLQISASVQYAVDRSGDRIELVRTIDQLGSSSPGKGRQVVLFDADATRFRVEYATGNPANPWVLTWDKSHLPHAVRISMMAVSPDRPWLQVSRKRVFPINVK